MPWGCCSRQSCPVAWTTVTHCSTAYLTDDDPVAVCSECCCASSVGCPSVQPQLASTTPVALAYGSEAVGTPPWSTARCPARHHHTWPVATDCQLVCDEAQHQLRSAISRTCVIRRTYSQFGDRCFTAAGPKLWNSLPVQLRQADISYEQFKRLLKTVVWSMRLRCIVTSAKSKLCLAK